MTKILLVSRNENDNVLIQKRFKASKANLGPLVFRTSRPATIVSQYENDIDIIFFNIPRLDEQVPDFISTCRRMNYLGPIVILAKLPKEMDEFKSMENVIVIGKPYENKELVGITKKIINDKHIAQRKFRRFDIAEKAILESYYSEFKAELTIHNISRGGVLVKGNLDGLDPNELVKIHFNLNKINKERTISARIAWSVIKEGTDESMAGLEFVPQEAVYQYLLKFA